MTRRADEFETLPIPSAIPRCEDVHEIAHRRQQLLGSSSQLVGHFGTFGSQVAPMLTDTLPAMLGRRGDLSAVFVGAGSDLFARQLMEAHPALQGAYMERDVSMRRTWPSSLPPAISCSSLTPMVSRRDGRQRWQGSSIVARS